jgi:hypothetical protein
MVFIKKETIMMDGEKVFDIDLIANGALTGVGKPICIFTCRTKADAGAFLIGLTKLVTDHTVEIMENFDDD